MKFLKSTGGFLTSVLILWLLIYFGQDGLSFQVSFFWIALYFCFYLLFLSFSKTTFLHRCKRNLWTVIIFLLIHFIVFPSIYVDILRDNPKSFEFDDYIQESEKEISIKEVVKEYSPVQLKSKINLIDSILTLESDKLKTELEYLKVGNILKIDSFQYYINIIERELLPGEDPNDTAFLFNLNICNNHGNFLISISNDYGSKINYNNTIRYFLTNKNNDLKFTLKNYQGIRRQIEEENIFWTYDKILPYSINIFNTSNINPKSRLANSLVWIHKVLIGFIGLIIAFFISRIKTIKSTEL